MKLHILTLAALVAFPFAISQAGEVYCPPAKDICCKAPVCCDPTGYIFAYGGYAFDYEADYTDGAPGVLDNDGGFIVGAGAGIYSDFLCGSRFEIEGLYTESDFNAVQRGATVANGDSTTYAIMVNALKEIPFGCVTAYGGVGIGYAWTDINVAGAGSDDDGALAYQLIVGADLPVADCVSLFAQYKLLGISETDYLIGANAINVEDYFTHSVSAGIRVSF